MWVVAITVWLVLTVKVSAGRFKVTFADSLVMNVEAMEARGKTFSIYCDFGARGGLGELDHAYTFAGLILELGGGKSM